MIAAGRDIAGVLLALVTVASCAVASCATPKAPLAEPQAPDPFASVVIECPPVLAEKDSGDSGVFTASFKLDLTLQSGQGSFTIDDACARKQRPLHVPPGTSRLAARYEERVKQRSSVLETPVSCELPTLDHEWVVGKTYLYRVSVTARDPRGRFSACTVALDEATEAKPGASASASASSAPPPSP